MLGENHPDLAVTLSNLGAVLIKTGDYAAAEPYLRQSHEIRRANFPAADRGLLATQGRLGVCLTKLGHFVEGESLLLDAYQQIKALAGDDQPWTSEAIQNLAELYDAWGRPAEARRWRGELAAMSQPASVPTSAGAASP